MKNSRLKNRVTYLFIFFFLSLKIVGLHGLSHIDDKDNTINCIVLDYVIANNLTPVLNATLQDFEVENAQFIFHQEVYKSYNYITSNSVTVDQLFSRPPPFLV